MKTLNNLFRIVIALISVNMRFFMASTFIELEISGSMFIDTIVMTNVHWFHTCDVFHQKTYIFGQKIIHVVYKPFTRLVIANIDKLVDLKIDIDIKHRGYIQNIRLQHAGILYDTVWFKPILLRNKVFQKFCDIFIVETLRKCSSFRSTSFWLYTPFYKYIIVRYGLQNTYNFIIR